MCEFSAYVAFNKAKHFNGKVAYDLANNESTATHCLPFCMTKLEDTEPAWPMLKGYEMSV